jgi:hypothetical protein
VEGDPHQREVLELLRTPSQPTSADAICAAIDTIVGMLPIAAIVNYTIVRTAQAVEIAAAA